MKIERCDFCGRTIGQGICFNKAFSLPFIYLNEKQTISNGSYKVCETCFNNLKKQVSNKQLS